MVATSAVTAAAMATSAATEVAASATAEMRTASGTCRREVGVPKVTTAPAAATHWRGTAADGTLVKFGAGMA